MGAPQSFEGFETKKGGAISDPAFLVQFTFYAVPVFDSSIPALVVLHPEVSGYQRHI